MAAADRTVTTFAALGQSVPSCGSARCLSLFAVRWRFFNTVFYVSPAERRQLDRSVALPAFALGAAVGRRSPSMRSAMRDVLGKNTSGHAGQASPGRWLFTMRSAMRQLRLSACWRSRSALIGASFIVGQVFALGIGFIARFDRAGGPAPTRFRVGDRLRRRHREPDPGPHLRGSIGCGR